MADPFTPPTPPVAQPFMTPNDVPAVLPPEPEVVESDYFGHLETEEIGSEIVDKARIFWNVIQNNGMLRSWIQRAQYYHGNFGPFGVPMNMGLEKTGDRGQYISYHVNHFRSILKTLLGLTTVNPPTFDIRSVNSDAASNQLAALGDKILDYYLRHKRVDNYLNRAVEHALIWDQGFVHLEWDINEGREFGDHVDPNYDGDLRVSNVLPPDMIFDPFQRDWNHHDWLVIRDRVKRVELLSRFPEYADDIKASTSDEDYKLRLFRMLAQNVTPEEMSLSDDVNVYKFYHRKTEYMPDGRYCLVLEDGTCLLDTPLPYDRIPVTRMVPDEKPGTTWGRSPALDLVAPQQALDILNSSIITNQSNFAVQYIACEQNTGITARMLDRGLIMLEYPAQGHPPQGINLTSTPVEVFKYREAIIQDMERIPGIAEVSRGAGAPAGTSGAAMALQASQTAQNQGILAHNFTSFAGATATLILKILRRFAQNERTLTILGKHSSGKDTFSAKDLVDFDRVIADLGNPMTHTFAGRVQVANELLNNGAVDAKGYITVLTTGNLDPMLEGPREAANYIRKENELMMDGVNPIVLDLDDHDAHIQEHMSILENIDYRDPRRQNDPQVQMVLKAATEHIMEHMQRKQSQMAPPPPPPGMPAGAPGQSAGPGPNGGAPPPPGPRNPLPGPRGPIGQNRNQVAPVPLSNGPPGGQTTTQAGLTPADGAPAAVLQAHHSNMPRVPVPPMAGARGSQ